GAMCAPTPCVMDNAAMSAPTPRDAGALGQRGSERSRAAADGAGVQKNVMFIGIEISMREIANPQAVFKQAAFAGPCSGRPIVQRHGWPQCREHTRGTVVAHGNRGAAAWNGRIKDSQHFGTRWQPPVAMPREAAGHRGFVLAHTSIQTSEEVSEDRTVR